MFVYFIKLQLRDKMKINDADTFRHLGRHSTIFCAFVRFLPSISNTYILYPRSTGNDTIYIPKLN